MADSPIHDLPAASSVAATDVVPIDQGNTTRKATMTQVSQAVGPINVGVGIHGANSKTTPIDPDELGLVDTADGNTLKKLTWANLKATLAALTSTWNISTTGNAGSTTKLQTARNIDATSFDGTADVTVVAPAIHAATSKATPVDADELGIWDSVSLVLNKLTWANLKTTLAGTFTTIASLAASSGASLVGFIQSGTGAVARTAQSKMREIVSFRDFGAVGDGVADDTTAVVNALATGKLIRDYGTFKITSTVTLPQNSNIVGVSHFGSDSFSTDGNLKFTISAGVTGFKATETNAGYELLGWNLENIIFEGGAVQISLPNGGVGWTMKNVVFGGPTTAAISANGFRQDWYWDNINFSGGPYGMYLPNTNGSLGATTLLDKCTFKDIYFGGQTINGALIKNLVSNNITWSNIKFINIVQDGMVIDGGNRFWQFININDENGAGYLGVAATPPTTGTINSGSPTLTVASATGLAIGQTLTVAGAGPNNADLSSVVLNLVGTTVTLTDNASTSVVSTEVVNYLYSTIKITSSVATSGYITFIGGAIGFSGGLGAAKYAVDLSGCAQASFINCANSRPIYDVTQSVQSFAGSGPVRPNNPLTVQTFNQILLGNNDLPYAMIPSPNGKNLYLVLRDSLGNATGTYGNFELRKYNPNRDLLFKIDGTYGDLSNRGLWVMAGYGAGTGAPGTLGFTDTGMCYGSAAPSAGTWSAGSKVFNQFPAVGQPKGWICTVAGTPGTWVSEGNL